MSECSMLDLFNDFFSIEFRTSIKSFSIVKFMIVDCSSSLLFDAKFAGENCLDYDSGIFTV